MITRPSRSICRIAVLLALAACTVPASRRAPLHSVIRVVTATSPAAAKPAWKARRVVADATIVAGARVHVVKRGETGIAIARAYGADWSKVAAANGLKPPYTLEVGDKLLLPSALQVAAMSVEDRAKAFKLDIDDIITGGEPAQPPGAPEMSRPSTVASARGAGKPAAKSPMDSPAIAGDVPQLAWPVAGRILSGFGAKAGGRFNDGVNLKASAGDPVRAAGDGVVAYAGDAIPGFGNLVLVKHAAGWVTAYAHAETLLVTRGKRVAKGDVIARAGSTGSVGEPQVHFEIRRGRTPVDPARIIGGR